MRISHVLHFHRILPLFILLCTLPVWAQDQSNCAPAGPCPKIKLPWGTWLADSYDQQGDFYTFKNIRFGKAPVGVLRFAASLPPDNITNPDDVQDNTKGSSCIAINPKGLKSCKKKGGATLGLGEGTPYHEADTNQSEDCLFLDLYVPRSAIGGEAKIPVVVWFYGGAFLFGSKSPPAWDGILYSGTSFLREAKAMGKQMIFVVGNYRLGAFGWLAGSYMESHGTPNAGLTDQQLLLQWVHDHISLVGGDNTQVSAWGESAGGSSILHHLVMNNGQTDPFFQKAIVQSAAYYWAWNRSAGGTLDQTYHDFAKQADCPDGDIACLRAAPLQKLKTANHKIAIPGACQGRMLFGPAVDGKLVMELPPVAFQKGNYWKGIESMILSHVDRESNMFVPKNIENQQEFNQFIDAIFPKSVANEIEKTDLYSGKLQTQRQRLIKIARDAFFTGNILQLFNAYKSTGKVYITSYLWPYSLLSSHGLDLIPTFFFKGCSLSDALKQNLPIHIPDYSIEKFVHNVEFFAPRYQQYFISHAITGDPNELIIDEDKASHYTWKPATLNSQGMVMQVMQSMGALGGGDFGVCSPKDPTCFKDITDKVLLQKRGNFWNKVASELTALSSSPVSLSSEQKPLKASDEIKEEL